MDDRGICADCIHKDTEECDECVLADKFEYVGD